MTCMVSILYARDARLTASGGRPGLYNNTTYSSSKRTGTIGTSLVHFSNMDREFLSECELNL